MLIFHWSLSSGMNIVELGCRCGTLWFFNLPRAKNFIFSLKFDLIWPIFPNDSESLPKVCYIKRKNSEILSKLRNSEPVEVSAVEHFSTFSVETKNREGKGGKYLEKKIHFRGGKEKQSRKTRKCLEKENIFFCGEEVTEKEKGGNNWTRKIHFFAEREGKGGKYLEKENTFLRRRRRGGKI